MKMVFENFKRKDMKQKFTELTVFVNVLDKLVSENKPFVREYVFELFSSLYVAEGNVIKTQLSSKGSDINNISKNDLVSMLRLCVEKIKSLYHDYTYYGRDKGETYEIVNRAFKSYLYVLELMGARGELEEN